MPIDRPDWLSEPCPGWCSGDHRGQAFPADRRHESEHVLVPVIQRRTEWSTRDLHPTHVVEPDALTLAVVREVEQAETWVAVASDHQCLEITLESARRLHGALGRLLEEQGSARRVGSTT